VPRLNCVSVAKSGKPCSGPRHSGTDYCYFHDPAISAEARRITRSNGGTAARGKPHLHYKTGDQILKILAKAMDQFMCGQMSIDTLKGLCDVARTQAYVHAQMHVGDKDAKSTAFSLTG